MAKVTLSMAVLLTLLLLGCSAVSIKLAELSVEATTPIENVASAEVAP